MAQRGQPREDGLRLWAAPTGLSRSTEIRLAPQNASLSSSTEHPRQPRFLPHHDHHRLTICLDRPALDKFANDCFDAPHQFSCTLAQIPDSLGALGLPKIDYYEFVVAVLFGFARLGGASWLIGHF